MRFRKLANTSLTLSSRGLDLLALFRARGFWASHLLSHRLRRRVKLDQATEAAYRQLIMMENYIRTRRGWT